jgi:deazaflavin-dependent oxidoreductase (nitroreductase family)
MTAQRQPPSGLLKLGFKVPVWLYRAHLGFLFGGRVFAIVHHGRRSGKRYVSGLEVLVRRDVELFAFSAWGTRADWYRNIEAGGVDELWDGRTRHPGATFRLLAPDQAYEALAAYEQRHPHTARRTLPRMLDGYDFTAARRHELAATCTIIAFRPTRD